jgi:molybdopterin converting factor small subunit
MAYGGEAGRTGDRGSQPLVKHPTITIRVRFHNILRRLADAERDELSLPERTSLREVLERLKDLHGAPLSEMLLTPAGEVASHLVVFRNGSLLSRDDYSEPLTDQDELQLFPAVSGG